MDEELEQRRDASLALCNRLISDMERFTEDAHLFFGGEIHKPYLAATEKAINEAKTVRRKLRNL